MSGIMKFFTILAVIGVVFFLCLGIWSSFLRKFVGEAQNLKEPSLLKSMRKVLLRRMGVVNRMFIWPKYEEKINQRIMHAGGLEGLTPEEVMSLQELSLVAFSLFGVILINFIKNTLGMGIGYGWTFLFLLIGMILPFLWLNDQVKKRHFKITRALPYNLDLLTLSVEAGLDFQAGVGTVVKKGRESPLTEEFALLLKEMRMGKTRPEALRSMSDRVGLPPLTSFASALIQAERMGTSLGKVLRIQSTQLRIDRTQRAEKLANEAPVKMLFPLIACIFPTVFLVLFAPIIFAFVWGGAMG